MTDSRITNKKMTNTMTNKTMNTLLEITRIMALSDGSISKEEEQLIRDLPDHIAYEAGENDHIQRLESSIQSLEELVALLKAIKIVVLLCVWPILWPLFQGSPVIARRSMLMSDVFIKNSFRSSISLRRILIESKPQPCKS